MKNLNSDCEFCRIISGNEESSIVFEDIDIMAIMDIQPVNTGVVLIISKTHIDHFCDIPDDLASKIFLLAQKLSRVLMKKIKPLRVGYLVHGFGVSHAHLIVIPMNNSADVVSKKQLKIMNNEIIDDISLIARPSRKELDKIANLLRKEL
ncbi:MAG: HIT domain-containing protein [Ignavibacteria bacterium]|nr:HIT domain-containing protein [Ignavibacteria bacterium]